ncbi:MAG: DUF4340 domain-containing protein, partial [Planctomycetes bacterium]|nr:DUF4340 domain-containing protein [Planctomycetota bacterium]
RFALESYGPRSVADRFAGLRYLRTITPNSEGAPTTEQMGLDNPRAVVSVSAGDKTWTLRLGRISLAGKGYAQLKGTDTIYVVDSDLHGAVLDGNDGAVRSRQRSFATLLREYLRLLGRRRIAVVLALAACMRSNRRSAWPLLIRPMHTVVTRMLSLAKSLESPLVIAWPAAREMEVGMDAVPGVRIAFEPKPYEPRGRILFGTTPEGVLLGHQVESLLTDTTNRALLDEGHALCCLNPEVGHVLMGFEDLAYAFSWPLSQGRLAHSHWNSQPLGNYDQDLNVGVVSPEQLEALLYTLKMHGYGGYFGIDINPERMPVDTAIRISMDAIRAANDRVNELDHEAIMFAHEHPDKARGWLEAHLIRARAPHPDRLMSLPRPS